VDRSHHVSLPLGGQLQAEVLVDDVWHPAVMTGCRCRERTWQCRIVYVDRTGDTPVARAGWHDSDDVRTEARPWLPLRRRT